MKKIIFTSFLLLFSCSIFAQTYNMKIKQGTGTTYSATSTVDEITFLNTTTTPFVCGDVILYGGETYHTISISSQCWFQENLNIGTRINGSTDQQSGNGIEKYCYNNSETNCTTYGGLYQWAEAVAYTNGATNISSPDPAFSGNIQGICPTGWHIPTYSEFETLQTAVGGSTQGNVLKAIGQGTGSGGGTNTSGFSALLAGYRWDYNGGFLNLGTYAYFWSSTEYSSVHAAYNVNLISNNSNITFDYNPKYDGFSVRCLKD